MAVWAFPPGLGQASFSAFPYMARLLGLGACVYSPRPPGHLPQCRSHPCSPGTLLATEAKLVPGVCVVISCTPWPPWPMGLLRVERKGVEGKGGGQRSSWEGGRGAAGRQGPTWF